MTSGRSVLITVAVNRAVTTEFTYVLNTDLGNEIIGARVKVPLAHSETTGVITGILNESNCSIPFEKIKSAKLLDKKGIIPNDIAAVLKFGSDYYHYPLGQCYATALPKKLRDGEPCAYEKIPGIKLSSAFDTEKFETLRSAGQKEIIEILKDGPARRKELRERGFSPQQECSLVKKGLAEFCDLNIPSPHWQQLPEKLLRQTPPVPNEEQQQAIDTVCSCKGSEVFLLNGVTGSGKTEVYLRIIEHVLSQGKAVLLLVPEIALTPQTFERFYRRFNVPVSSMHSQLSDRERLDAYIDMLTQRSAILIGTRTALFTPIPHLGLIVLDEEHDTSFKQTDGFRYHARSLAIIRAKICNCPVILGSATPSLESFYNVFRGAYRMLRLTIRAGGAQLPEINLIDLREEPMSPGLKAGVGETLEMEMGEETVRGNQVLLFLNRRGYSHHLLCHRCGHVFSCPSCDNPLTVHRALGKLKCHICEYQERIPLVCPVCGEKNLMETGFGTEQTEEFLHMRYPDLGIERIDRDTVTTKAQLETRLARIRSGESSILLGTQMIAKGHDFPNVTLVGIIDLDSNLFSDDFRAQEYSAQLLTQVAGRAGRAQKRGRVLIQTHHPDNLLVNNLIDPNISYEQVAQFLLETRRSMNLPPYSFQAFLLTNSRDRVKAFDFLSDLLQKAESILDNYPALVVTPVLSDKMEKRQNRYHFHVLVTANDRTQLSGFIKTVLDFAKDECVSGDVRFAVEVDPIMMY